MSEQKKYRKKPVVIEAVQWFKHGDHPEVDYYRHLPVDPATGEITGGSHGILMGKMRHREVPPGFRLARCDRLMHDHGWIDTLEGGHTVCPGDWIVRGVQGEFYPVKEAIFRETYEEADDE